MRAFREVLLNFKKSGFMSLISIGTIAITIIILGSYFIANSGINYFLSKVENKIEIVVFLKEEFEFDKIKNTITELEALPEVENIKFISKDEAYQEFIKNKEISMVLESFDKNPLPDSIKIKLKNYTQKNIEKIINTLKSKEGIDEIQYGGREIENLINILNVVKIITAVIGVIFVISSLLVVSNIIKLTIYARRQDIYIFKMVGATNFFIKIPFVLEGIIHGFFGGIIGWTVLYVIINILLTEIKKETGLDFSKFYLFTPAFFSFKFLIESLIAGILLGFSGSILSLGNIKEK